MIRYDPEKHHRLSCCLKNDHMGDQGHRGAPPSILTPGSSNTVFAAVLTYPTYP